MPWHVAQMPAAELAEYVMDLTARAEAAQQQ
jgi:hypothetical protein